MRSFLTFGVNSHPAIGLLGLPEHAAEIQGEHGGIHPHP